MEDIDEATDRVIAGPAKKTRVISKKNAILLLSMKVDIR
jgi:ATP-dependent Zn protease